MKVIQGWWRSALIAVALASIALVVAGHLLFDRDHSDPLGPADAIVVLGGEHDGREDYGLELARQGYAKTVVISNPVNHPYSAQDPIMQRVCAPPDDIRAAGIEVICFNPNPSTTRGEAMYTEQLAKQRGWSRVIVISWRYHLVRARYIFGQCSDLDTAMRAVPRDYSTNPGTTLYIYAYQYVGLIKALVLGCR